MYLVSCCDGESETVVEEVGGIVNGRVEEDSRLAEGEECRGEDWVREPHGHGG